MTTVALECIRCGKTLRLAKMAVEMGAIPTCCGITMRIRR